MALAIPGPQVVGSPGGVGQQVGGLERVERSGRLPWEQQGKTEAWLGSRKGPAGCKAQSTPSATITQPGAAVLKGQRLVSGPTSSITEELVKRCLNSLWPLLSLGLE